MFLFYPCLTNEVAAVETEQVQKKLASKEHGNSLNSNNLHGGRSDAKSLFVDNSDVKTLLRTPEDIRRESADGIPPPKILPANSPKHQYQPTWESLESRPLPEWYDDAKVFNSFHFIANVVK